jgi:hypothetical protein
MLITEAPMKVTYGLFSGGLTLQNGQYAPCVDSSENRVVHCTGWNTGMLWKMKFPVLSIQGCNMKSRIKNTVMKNGKRYVCRIYDIGRGLPAGDYRGVCDRYTIAFKGYYITGYGMVYPYLASNGQPFHPGGFGQYGESRMFLTGKHLGMRVRFEDVPEQVQQFIMQNLGV